MAAQTASADSKTEVALAWRAYNWLDGVLPLRLNLLLAHAQSGFKAIGISRFVPAQIRSWWKLKRLQKAKSNIYDLYNKRHKEYREIHADAQLEQLNSEEIYELSIISEKIYQLHSERITAQAERYLVPVPQIDHPGSDWEVARISGRWRLRREALVALLAAIRNEQAKRREAAQGNVIWVAALTGMVGTVIGLVAGSAAVKIRPTTGPL
jgi:hypothetical protein